eukprot:TRINITY_DN17095_c0_g2_i1.p1 TRINITY_DN17095_c0_g2~~TRINITY_DN17095_c0_g2_i1.p1  ORF type:complete len:136 (+),score=20.98 TRINITY_DN17095_c0_g2_i1:2042-2449(+)
MRTSDHEAERGGTEGRKHEQDLLSESDQVALLGSVENSTSKEEGNGKVSLLDDVEAVIKPILPRLPSRGILWRDGSGNLHGLDDARVRKHVTWPDLCGEAALTEVKEYEASVDSDESDDEDSDAEARQNCRCVIL